MTRTDTCPVNGISRKAFICTNTETSFGTGTIADIGTNIRTSYWNL